MSSTPTKVNPFATIEDDGIDDFVPKPIASRVDPAQGSQTGLSAPAPSRTAEKAQVARLAEKSGFTIKNYDEKPIPARVTSAANTFLKTVRLQVHDWNKFQVWCHENGYSHWKGFQVLTSALPPKKI